MAFALVSKWTKGGLARYSNLAHEKLNYTEHSADCLNDKKFGIPKREHLDSRLVNNI